MRQLGTTIHDITPPSTTSGIFRGSGYAPLKRIVDVVLAAGLLLIFAPLMLLVAVAIKLCSDAPIFYRQQRSGRGGIPFTMLQFRSMHCGWGSARRHESPCAVYQSGGSLKLQHDPRVTHVGRFLRRSSLDELPQLVNVLRGEMSLVGPRPPLPCESELYQAWHRHRLSVLPGITGLWQVTARNTVPFDEMVRIDLRYIETMNLWLDLRIMLRTPRAMLRGK